MSDSESEAEFPEIGEGFFDEDSGTWRKPVSRNEQNVYELLSESHPRIIAFQGIAEMEQEEYLVLQYHPKGDLWTYLLNNDPSLSTRIHWAIEIAEGIAYLHSKSIVWADPHLRNILVTEDLHVVLTDFAFSIISPDWMHRFSTMPPPIFACPTGFWGMTPNRADIFGFGVILFALLTRRFPWVDHLAPSLKEQLQIFTTLHEEEKWDTVGDSKLREHFGEIVEKCFKVKYMSGDGILGDLKQCFANWSEDVANAESDHQAI
ncbi:kinase-like domain-containing protein [Lentinula raphanica]|uniref:Kinase-like domain-containing protein n=1 Tax=Lentinula raphanica TaxID=153919 RepID=A0AA38UBB1_9AGAR|nr:kinase-like domain-containing protein [Lentinula raphanica]KAJ3835996.1 kinase-like domain-containing protein [Lentinula raphanica]